MGQGQTGLKKERKERKKERKRECNFSDGKRLRGALLAFKNFQNSFIVYNVFTFAVITTNYKKQNIPRFVFQSQDLPGAPTPSFLQRQQHLFLYSKFQSGEMLDIRGR